MALSPGDQAWSEQYDQQQLEKDAQPPQTHSDVVDAIHNETGGAGKKLSLFQQFGNLTGRVTTNILDGVISAADSMYDSEPVKKARDVVAGGIEGATNVADTVIRAADGTPIPGTKDVVASPIWDHAKQEIMNFRDSVAVQDPTLADNLVQGVGQLALPFAGYSRAVGALHGLSNVLAAGVLTDATALEPHASRLADMVSLGKQTEGKYGEVLRDLAPDGSALNAYINYLGDRSNESEAEGRFKNVLDGLGANLIATPLLHTVGMVLKQGGEGLRYAMENGVASTDRLMPANQDGQIGWHGTPHEIDPATGFDDSKIGTGEGNQVYGYGHYIAQNPKTANFYASNLTMRSDTAASTEMKVAKMRLNDANGDKQSAYAALIDQAAKATDPATKARYEKAASFIKNGGVDSGYGNVYKVDIPDAKIDAMLDHDKLLKDQPEVLKKIPEPEQEQIKQYIENADEHYTNYKGDLGDLTGQQLRVALERMHANGEFDTGEKGFGMYDAPMDTSRYLAERGIPGIKYLDGGSRGSSTRNFVLFNGKDAAITHKNGVPVGNQNMNLSKEERALERERIAAIRSREAGFSREVEPEPIPANAARVEGEAARRDRRKDSELGPPKVDTMTTKEIQEMIDKLRAEHERRMGRDPDAKIEGSRK
jgi:hypothetical protein